MEPLDFPEAIPPRGENHYLGQYISVFDENGKLAEIIWVRHRRNLMSNFQQTVLLSRPTWFQVFNQRNGTIIGSLPTPGMR